MRGREAGARGRRRMGARHAEARGRRRPGTRQAEATSAAGRAALLLAVAAAMLPPLPAPAQSLPEAREALRGGMYQEAVRAYRDILDDDPASVEARIGLMRALAVTGEHAEAAEVGRAAPHPVPVANTLGEVLLERGDRAGARAAFQRGDDRGAADGLTARMNLAELLFLQGEVDEAMERFDAFIDVYNRSAGSLTARDLVAVGRAVRHLGRTDPAYFQDALEAFDEAAAADPGWAEPAVRTGDLFLEKYSSPEAQTEYGKVLRANPRHPEALLGMARALEFDGTGGVGERARAVLEVNPRHVGALILLAKLHLTREEPEEALALVQSALEVNPNSLDALSGLAAVRFLTGDEAGFEAARERALALSPRYAGLDATVAELAVQVRRYEEAARRAEAAVALDSASWRAWGLLGMNRLRLGHMEEGREHLERAFAGDPYNPWFKNNLDLLDTFERFESVPTEHFRLFLHGTEDDLLAPYVAGVAEEAWDSLSARYGVEPEAPVRLELYPDHADFSVRTLGETGLGALGVSFGPVLVMDSPAARERGQYNWASVLWHELAHTFHLSVTDHRVPRWFSEGLAVHEQRKARTGWGHQPNIPFLQAFQAGRLKPVSQLNDGFMRPDYPQQVVFSYYQASLVFQVIEDRHGFGAIRALLDGYRTGRTTEELFPEVLGTTLEEFDDDFEAWMRDRFEAPLRGLAPLGEAPPVRAGLEVLEGYVRRHPGDLLGRLRLGAALVDAERYEEAREHLTEALRMFPEYGGPDSPYWHLARIHRARGDLERAAAALVRLNALSESNYAALMAEAELHQELGRPAAAARALDRTVQVYPYDPDVHERLAELLARTGDLEGAVRERQAVVALDPPDRARAFYLLARAQLDAGDREAARSSVLASLEVAPNYEEALELLLELRGGSGEAGS